MLIVILVPTYLDSSNQVDTLCISLVCGLFFRGRLFVVRIITSVEDGIEGVYIKSGFTMSMASSVLNYIFRLGFAKLFFNNSLVERIENDSISAREIKRRGPFEHSHNNFVASVLRHKLSQGVYFIDKNIVKRGAELW